MVTRSGVLRRREKGKGVSPSALWWSTQLPLRPLVLLLPSPSDPRQVVKLTSISPCLSLPSLSLVYDFMPCLQLLPLTKRVFEPRWSFEGRWKVGRGADGVEGSHGRVVYVAVVDLRGVGAKWTSGRGAARACEGGWERAKEKEFDNFIIFSTGRAEGDCGFQSETRSSLSHSSTSTSSTQTLSQSSVSCWNGQRR